MNRTTLSIAVAEARRFIARTEELPQPEPYEVPGSERHFTHDNYPRQQGAIKRASMDLTRALADLRRAG